MVNWLQSVERAVGDGHPSLTTTINRPLREALAEMGQDPDAIVDVTTLRQLGPVSAVAFSATPVFDASIRDAFEITLTGNVTSSTLINMTPGQRLVFRVAQDAGGGHTFAWPTNVRGAGTIGSNTNEVSQQEFQVGIDMNAYALAAIVVGM